MQAALTPFEEFKIRIRTKEPDTRERYTDAILAYAKSQKLDVNDIPKEPIDQIQERLKWHFYSITRSKYNILLSALKQFFTASQIDAKINWNYITGYKPENPQPFKDEAYTWEQIQTLDSEAPNDRVRLTIRTMSTAGLRIGAFPDLYVKHLTWIEEYKLYQVLVYPDAKEEYRTFITPKTSEIMRDVIGKRGPERPIFYNLHEPDLPATKGAHESAIWRLLVRTGMRKPVKATERHKIQMDHGFRKYFRSALDAAQLREDYAERLTGHGKDLVNRYSRLTPLQWLETSGYLNVIDKLRF